MKTCLSVVLLALLAFQLPARAEVFFYNVDHGSLTQLSNDGFWRRYATEFPIVGGWMDMNSPTDAGDAPNGHIWVHQVGSGWGTHWGAYHTPITIEQYDNPALINRTWSWGIYYVYGQNKILEYGAFDYQYPPGSVSYTISYSATVVPEPCSSSLILLGLLGSLGLGTLRR